MRRLLSTLASLAIGSCLLANTASAQTVSQGLHVNNIVLDGPGGKTLTLYVPSLASSKTFTFPDLPTNSSMLLNQGGQTLAGNLSINGAGSFLGLGDATNAGSLYLFDGHTNKLTFSAANLGGSDYAYSWPSMGSNGTFLMSTGVGSTMAWHTFVTGDITDAATKLVELSPASPQTGNINIHGTLAAGSSGQLTIDASGNVSTSGTISSTNTTSGPTNLVAGKASPSGTQGTIKLYDGTSATALNFQAKATGATGTYTFPSPAVGVFTSDASGNVTMSAGTANQVLAMNAGATGFTWVSQNGTLPTTSNGVVYYNGTSYSSANLGFDGTNKLTIGNATLDGSLAASAKSFKVRATAGQSVDTLATLGDLASNNTNVNITGGTVDPDHLKTHDNNGHHYGWTLTGLTGDHTETLGDKSISHAATSTDGTRTHTWDLSNLSVGNTETEKDYDHGYGHSDGSKEHKVDFSGTTHSHTEKDYDNAYGHRDESTGDEHKVDLSGLTLGNQTHTEKDYDHGFSHSDGSREAKFDFSGITAATTRTYSLPDANGTILTSGSPVTYAYSSVAAGGTVSSVAATVYSVADNGTASSPTTATFSATGVNGQMVIFTCEDPDGLALTVGSTTYNLGAGIAFRLIYSGSSWKAEF